MLTRVFHNPTFEFKNKYKLNCNCSLSDLISHSPFFCSHNSKHSGYSLLFNEPTASQSQIQMFCVHLPTTKFSVRSQLTWSRKSNPSQSLFLLGFYSYSLSHHIRLSLFNTPMILICLYIYRYVFSSFMTLICVYI